jgi:hypothetical protein
MAGQVDVLNTALGFLGKEPVPDLSDASQQQSAALVKLLRSIETSRETVLARHGWLCALTYASLAPAVIPGYSNWRYPMVFRQPAGCLRIWEVSGWQADEPCLDVGFGFGPASEPRWEIATIEPAGGGAASKVILVGRNFRDLACDNGNLPISFVRTADWSALSAHVADAIAADVAWRQARSITGKEPLVSAMAQQKEAAVQMAISIDGTQTGGQPPLAGSIPARIRRFAGNAGAEFGPWDRGY